MKAPSFVLAVSLMLGIMAGRYTDGEDLGWLAGTMPVIGTLSFINPTILGLMGTGFTSGVVMGCLQNFLYGDEPNLSGMILTLSGKVAKVSPGLHGRTDLKIRVSKSLSDRVVRSAFPAVLSLKGKQVPEVGSDVKMRVELKEINKARNFGKVVRAKCPGDSLLVGSGAGITSRLASGRVESVLRKKSEAVAGLLAGLALGRRREIDRNIHNILTKTGTCHLMAISGVHLGAALLVPFLLAQVIFSGFLVDRIGWKSTVPVALGIITSVLYLSLTGLSASAVRAGLFVVLYWGAMIAGRYSHSLTVLGWCVVLIVSFTPLSQPDTGLLLSASAVTGIIMTDTGPGRALKRVFRGTMGAVLFTLPLSVWFAGGVSVVAPICNLLAGVVFGFVLIPIAVLIDLLAYATPPWEFLVDAWIRIADPLMTVLGWLAGLPPAFLVLSREGCFAASAASVTALFIWNKRDFRVRAGILLFILIVLTAGAFEKSKERLLKAETVLCFPRVGQADAAIFRGDGKTFLIDCAGSGRPGFMTSLERQLIKMGVPGIAGVFLTHNHPDHIGGFRNIASRWEIDAVYLPEFNEDQEKWKEVISLAGKNTRLVSLKEGDRVRIGPFSLLVLGPRRSAGDEISENARSLQLSVKWPGNTALFTGDASWEQALASMKKVNQLELLKMPHHGSKAGFPPAGLAATLSRLSGKGEITAVFPSPPPGEYSLPSEDVVEWFEKNGVKCLFTGHGDGLIFKAGKINRYVEFIKDAFWKMFDA